MTIGTSPLQILCAEQQARDGHAVVLQRSYCEQVVTRGERGSLTAVIQCKRSDHTAQTSFIERGTGPEGLDYSPRTWYNDLKLDAVVLLSLCALWGAVGRAAPNGSYGPRPYGFSKNFISVKTFPACSSL